VRFVLNAEVAPILLMKIPFFALVLPLAFFSRPPAPFMTHVRSRFPYTLPMLLFLRPRPVLAKFSELLGLAGWNVGLAFLQRAEHRETSQHAPPTIYLAGVSRSTAPAATPGPPALNSRHINLWNTRASVPSRR